jgi:phosphoribosylglycinamide formyltransferase-1
MTNIAIFASGSGSNAENLIHFFKENPKAAIVAIFSDNPGAFVLERATKLKVPYYVLAKGDMKDGTCLKQLHNLGVNMIVLAGFLKLIPAEFLRDFKGKIINLHPSLLPKFGGKGMFGMHVHNAVIQSGEKVSGITIHHVNEHYDEGEIIARFEVLIEPKETAETLAQKIHDLEMRHFPGVIASLIKQNGFST